MPVASPAAEASDPLAWLDGPERFAYEYFCANRNQRNRPDTFPLAPDTAAGLFALYLNGRQLPEIRDQFPKFGLGQIVHAAVEGKWNERRQGYLDGLLDRAKGRALQVAAESVEFIADSMAAAHKLHGNALRQFLVTGDPKDLGAFGIGSMKQYGEMVALLTKITGQDGNKRVAGTVKHEHTVRSIPTAPPPAPVAGASAALLGVWATSELAKQSGQDEDE